MKSKKIEKRLPAEWEEQEGILIAWPHENTDWAPYLTEVENVYLNIIEKICLYEKVYILTNKKEYIISKLQNYKTNLENIYFLDIEINDTWTRDYGPISIIENNKIKILNFVFNGWGLKFPAFYDNLVNIKLKEMKFFKKNKFKNYNLVLEGGSIDSDGCANILTTTKCLLSSNRNPEFNKKKIEKKLRKYFGAKNILWLEHGYLEGDDTDGHIDTLARFCPDNKIAYVKCYDKNDIHFEELNKMENELYKLIKKNDLKYELIPIPLPEPCYDDENNRLPATYINFLIINNAVLIPIYNKKTDNEAIEIFKNIFKNREVISINCFPLIKQHGSLHCITMQLPKGACI